MPHIELDAHFPGITGLLEFRVLTAIAVLFVGVLVTTLGGYGNSLFVFSLVFLVGLLVVVFVKDMDQ